MSRKQSITHNVDWIILTIYFCLISLGIATIYSTAYTKEFPSIFDFHMPYGRQIVWLAISLLLGLMVLLIDVHIYRKFTLPIYLSTLLLLVLVLFTSPVNGTRAWLGIGSFGIQPAEFAKIGTAILLASYISKMNIRAQKVSNICVCLLILILPMILIALQPDAGTLVIFTAFLFVFYREGITFDPLVLLLVNSLPGIRMKKTWVGTHFIPILFILTVVSLITLFFSKTTFDLPMLGLYNMPSFIGIIFAYFLLSILFYFIGRSLIVARNRKNFFWLILFSFLLFSFLSVSISTLFNTLKPHQKTRIELLLGLNEDDQRDGADYNRNRAMTAVGSGGWVGKGYRKATLATFESNHVPESETDFIFCPFAEEWGFMGTSLLVGLYVLLLLRIFHVAERQRSTYNRIYAYCVGIILFYHFTINIGMSIGVFPVIGIPLPFFSYGGSSMMSFSVMLFILLKIDSQRRDILF